MSSATYFLRYSRDYFMARNHDFLTILWKKSNFVLEILPLVCLKQESCQQI